MAQTPQAKPKTLLKKSLPKKPPSLLLQLFIVICIVLLAGAGWRYFEVKKYTELRQAHIEEKQEMQEALGWGSELKIEKKNDGISKIRFMLRDKARNPIQGAEVKITLTHVNENQRMLAQNALTLSLTMVEPGVYRGQTKLPLPGNWDAAIDAQIGTNTYQVSERIIIH